MAGCCGREGGSWWSRRAGTVLWVLVGVALLAVWIGRQTGLAPADPDPPPDQVGR
ncbi:MAG: hypothetical protein K2X87_17320 [Gemmataceae bacterium]|nr:hypothetical protein [Gemmataceae bacterium]